MRQVVEKIRMTGRFPTMTQIRFTSHDVCSPSERAMVDRGLDAYNRAPVPLDEVQPISCFARSERDEVIGGAVGRRWAACCELQQLWVEPSYRGQGIGKELVRTFEAHARSRGCETFYLETFNFQRPALYASLGYEKVYEHAVYPHGIVKFIMVKRSRSEVGP
jgi:ribosomal protein S18 acetylase RimI-like enzyme